MLRLKSLLHGFKYIPTQIFSAAHAKLMCAKLVLLTLLAHFQKPCCINNHCNTSFVILMNCW